jgi:(2Fe-2S) ferredoxin
MREVQEQGISSEVIITNTGCLGICNQGPIVIIYPDAVWYGSVTPDDAEEIVKSHILNDKIVDRLEI